MKRQLSTALGLVSRLFRSCSLPLKFVIPYVNWLFLNASHNQNLTYAISFQPNDEILLQQQKP